ncbi:MAG: HEAT repeat domain-containing protein [Acidobacteriota bacterium]
MSPQQLHLARVSLLLSLLALALLPSPGRADGVRLPPDPVNAGLEERLDWAVGEARQEPRGAWVGYSVELWATPRCHFVFGGLRITGNAWGLGPGPDLGARLGGATPLLGESAPINREFEDAVLRPIAVLLRLGSRGQVKGVDLVDFGIPADFEGVSLLWLGAASPDASFDALTALYGAGSASKSGREELVELVGVHDRPAAARFLGQVRDSDAAVSIREEAAEALADQTGPEALKLLVATARGSYPTAVREEAAEALGDSLAEGAEDALIDLVQEPALSISVRAEAVEALGSRPTFAAAEALEALLWGEEPLDVQEEALEALEDMGHWGEEAAVALAPDVEVLLTRVVRDHPRADLREEAVSSLAELLDDEALPLLREIVFQDESLEVQEEALDAVAELSGAEDFLIETARDHPHAELREEAVEYLAERSGDRVIGALEEVIYLDPSLSVQEEALESLGELPGTEGLALLVKVARTHPNREMRSEALEVLVERGSAGDRRALRALETLMPS